MLHSVKSCSTATWEGLMHLNAPRLNTLNRSYRLLTFLLVGFLT